MQLKPFLLDMGCHIYAFDDHAPETAYARFFNPTVGLWEDAATGTAAGPLAAYLASERRLKNNELAIETRHENGPPKHIACSHNARSRIVRCRHRRIARPHPPLIGDVAYSS